MRRVHFGNRFPTFNTPIIAETVVLISTLFVLEYIYVLGGLNTDANLVSVGLLYMLVLSYLLFEELRDESSLAQMITYYAILVVPAMGVMVFAILPGATPDVLLLVLLVVAVKLKMLDLSAPLGRAATLFLLGFGLLVLVGAFQHVGSNLSNAGTPAGKPISIYPLLASENAAVFGIRTPTIMFDVSNPSFHAAVHLVPMEIGAFSYVVARSEMTLDSGRID